jgi:hypothetical protein
MGATTLGRSHQPGGRFLARASSRDRVDSSIAKPTRRSRAPSGWSRFFESSSLFRCSITCSACYRDSIDPSFSRAPLTASRRDRPASEEDQACLGNAKYSPEDQYVADDRKRGERNGGHSYNDEGEARACDPRGGAAAARRHDVTAHRRDCLWVDCGGKAPHARVEGEFRQDHHRNTQTLEFARAR